MIKVNVDSEYYALHNVIVASAETYFDHIAINNNQELYYKKNPPIKELLVEQQKHFFDLLYKSDVNLVFSNPLNDCPDQLNTRDPSFSIGNTFFVSSMKESIRKKEKEGLKDIINTLDGSVVFLNDCTIEGGDIVVYGKMIFVGISRRTTMLGVEQLAKHLDQSYEIIPVYLKTGFLHLDTVFNIIGEKTALICEDALCEESVEMLNKLFTTIKITLNEQLHLGTNVLSIKPGVIISQIQNKRINNEMESLGFIVHKLDYSEAAKLGGAFRCGTCPIDRY